MYGELMPVGGGDPIPLLKKTLRIGRRENCDIVLRFPNVSAYHCELVLDNGYWYIRDTKSRNGVKVNGVRVPERRLDPGDMLSVASHRYEIQYSPAELGAVGPPPNRDLNTDVFSKSLLERAGLQHRDIPDDQHKRYDVLDDRAGQIKDPTRPI